MKYISEIDVKLFVYIIGVANIILPAQFYSSFLSFKISKFNHQINDEMVILLSFFIQFDANTRISFKIVSGNMYNGNMNLKKFLGRGNTLYSRVITSGILTLLNEYKFWRKIQITNTSNVN